jgi:antitoxin MazE
MRIAVQKWGNSLALRIPKAVAVESRLAQGTVVEVASARGRLIVTPVPKPTYTLDELLSGITKDNVHGEVDTGTPVGREIW